jgi:hypothetical protein
MKKVIKLTESDLEDIVKRVLQEQDDSYDMEDNTEEKDEIEVTLDQIAMLLKDGECSCGDETLVLSLERGDEEEEDEEEDEEEEDDDEIIGEQSYWSSSSGLSLGGLLSDALSEISRELYRHEGEELNRQEIEDLLSMIYKHLSQKTGLKFR